MKTLFLLSCILLLQSCNSGAGSTQPESTSYEETKMSLEDKERINPVDFLEADGTYRQNLIDEWVIEGTVTNSATIATYKDVVLKIVYYSKTKTEIGSEEKTIFEYFKPNESKKFKIKTSGFEGTESVGLDVVSAEPAQ
jgi:hypothetical protein